MGKITIFDDKIMYDSSCTIYQTWTRTYVEMRIMVIEMSSYI